MVVPTPNVCTTPVPPPAYQRAQAKVGSALHLDALTLVTRLHLLSLCSLAVRLAQRRCPPPLPAGPVVVALAAQQAGRPDLIRCPKRVLAHTWEGLLA